MPPDPTLGGRPHAFVDFVETLERGLANGIPRDAKLFLLGRISYAGERGELQTRLQLGGPARTSSASARSASSAGAHVRG
jgi:hypothetical protein